MTTGQRLVQPGPAPCIWTDRISCNTWVNKHHAGELSSSPEDEINHMLLLGFHLQCMQAPLSCKQDGKFSRKNMVETNKLSGFRCPWCTTNDANVLGWTVLVEAGGGGFHKWPQPPFLTERWESHLDLSSNSRQSTLYAPSHSVACFHGNVS